MSPPLIVQSDRTIFLEVDNPLYEAARNALAKFAELEKSPEHIHTYKITPISIWNASASGETSEKILKTLEKFSKFSVPENIKHEIKEIADRYGKIILKKKNNCLILNFDTENLALQLSHHPKVIPLLANQIDNFSYVIDGKFRGEIKRVLTNIGFPVRDLAGYVKGTPLKTKFRKVCLSKENFNLRNYQNDAAENFYQGGGPEGGCGVVVLPCGAGKTIVGMAAMTKVQTQTLIISTNITALRQWKNELLDKTNLKPDDIAEYSGQVKEIAPVTLCTYQILTYRPNKTKDFFPHFEIFHKKDWGLIIYDEVHLLPAPVFRITSDIQARRRLGLTATLVREDGKEKEVFSLVGPKRYDMPWKELEGQNWLAKAHCTEIRVELPSNERLDYAIAGDRIKFRIGSENSAKSDVIRKLIKKHKNHQILIIGQYISQLEALAKELKVPLITGKTKQIDRDILYKKFRNNDINILILSKVGNFAVDLPDANVAIQISGTFGSRQEEAQRLGRVLRPKPGDNQAHFYSIVTHNSTEQDFAMKRQLFLTEQGYSYSIINFADNTNF